MRLIRHFAQFPLIPLALFCCSAFAADVRVLRFEQAGIDFQTAHSTFANKTTNQVSGLRLHAFGTTYDVALQANAVAATINPTGGARAQTYRGAIVGRANSWVRITRVGDAVHGLMFDGRELLAIEPARAIGGASGNAIFKVADTQIDLESACALHSAPSDGLDLFNSLSSEAKTISDSMRKAGARTRLVVSVLTDAAFRNRFGGDAAAMDALVARINNVDGIFSSQLGVAVELDANVGGANQFNFDTTHADTLLQQVARMRGESPTLHATGLTHLFTGLDLDGKTIGIAYMDSVCDRRYAATLSEVRDRGAWFDSLVAAHELGHSFGSPHDAEGECAATPANYLMAANINGNDKFSQCSVNRIQARMQTASCLLPIPVADLSLSTPGETRAPAGSEFDWSIVAVNVGAHLATDSHLRITVPAALNVLAATVADGTCAVGGGEVHCALGTLVAGESRALRLALRATQYGNFTLAATVSASEESSTANNASNATIRIEPTVDVALTFTAPSTASLDQPLTATFVIANKSSGSATNVTVDLAIPAGLAFSGAPQLDGLACAPQFQTTRCSIASLAAGRTLTGSLTLIAHDAGTHIVTVTLGGDFSDPQPSDNIVQHAVTVAARAPVAAAAQSQPESGGGAFGNFLLILISFGLAQRMRC